MVAHTFQPPSMALKVGHQTNYVAGHHQCTPPADVAPPPSPRGPEVPVRSMPLAAPTVCSPDPPSVICLKVTSAVLPFTISRWGTELSTWAHVVHDVAYVAKPPLALGSEFNPMRLPLNPRISVVAKSPASSRVRALLDNGNRGISVSTPMVGGLLDSSVPPSRLVALSPHPVTLNTRPELVQVCPRQDEHTYPSVASGKNCSPRRRLRVHAALRAQAHNHQQQCKRCQGCRDLNVSIHYLSLSWVFGLWPRRGRRGWSLGHPWATDSRSAHGAWPSRSGSGASPASAHPITQIRAIERQRGLATSFRQQHNQRSLPRCSCSRQNPLHCQVPSS